MGLLSFLMVLSFAINARAFYEWDLKDPKKLQFRYVTAQQVWEKAHRHEFGEPKLRSLYGVLEKFDLRAVDWKDRQHKGEDEDGMMEAQVRDDIHRIMVAYGIIRADRAGQEYENSKFKNHEMDLVWEDVVKKNIFTPEELNLLEVEFHHHVSKLHEYHALDFVIDKENRPKRHDEEKKRKKLFNDNEDFFGRLDLKMAKAQGSDILFTEPRIQQLWNLAMKQDLSEEEQNSLREELAHFEVKLQRQRHLEQQLSKSGQQIGEYNKYKSQQSPEERSYYWDVKSKFDDLSHNIRTIARNLGKKLKGTHLVEHFEL